MEKHKEGFQHFSRKADAYAKPQRRKKVPSSGHGSDVDSNNVASQVYELEETAPWPLYIEAGETEIGEAD
jgi:hypothetical protein